MRALSCVFMALESWHSNTTISTNQSTVCLYIWTNERSPLCLPAQHEGPVQGLALIDLLHQQSYHSGLQHHALVTGGASNDRWADWEIYNMLLL